MPTVTRRLMVTVLSLAVLGTAPSRAAAPGTGESTQIAEEAFLYGFRASQGRGGECATYIQHDSPGPDKEANWLPAPTDRFILMMRMY